MGQRIGSTLKPIWDRFVRGLSTEDIKRMMQVVEKRSIEQGSASLLVRARATTHRSEVTAPEDRGRRPFVRKYFAAVAMTFGALLFGLGSASSAAPRLDGQEAPDFVLKTLEQQNLRLSEFRGQVVLINFWASWCGACRQAMPALNEIRDKYQRAGLVMLSVNLDDEAHRALHMAQSLKIKYPVLLDDRKAVSRTYQVETMPLTVLIDREGVVRFVHVGYNAGDQGKFVAPLRALLNE